MLNPSLSAKEHHLNPFLFMSGSCLLLLSPSSPTGQRSTGSTGSIPLRLITRLGRSCNKRSGAWARISCGATGHETGHKPHWQCPRTPTNATRESFGFWWLHVVACGCMVAFCLMLLLHEVSSRAHSILELPSSRLPAVQFAQEMWETAGRLLGPVAPGGGREGPVATPSRAVRSLRS